LARLVSFWKLIVTIILIYVFCVTLCAINRKRGWILWVELMPIIVASILSSSSKKSGKRGTKQKNRMSEIGETSIP
jgi:hypothetical protein